jgi:hypothetical protein
MNKLAWEKINIDEVEINVSQITPEMLNGMNEEDDDQPMIPFLFDYVVQEPKIRTPFGEYSLDDAFSPYKLFDCWICHTNFPITSYEYLLLDNHVPGIGALKVISKYRFCIGIEKLFSITEVRENIHSLLCGNDDVVKQSRKIDTIMSKINTDGDWAVFIGDDGEIESSSIDNDGDEYKKNLASMRKRRNGKLIVSEKR